RSWGCRVSALVFHSVLFPPTRPALRPRHVSPVGWRVLGPGTTPGLPSIRAGPATAPSTLYRVRPWRPARLHRGPTHRTNGALPRLTRRQTGGSLRPHGASPLRRCGALGLPGESLVSPFDPRLTPPPPAPGRHAAVPSSPPSGASPSPTPLAATRPAPGSATARSTASAPRPRCRPSAP